MSDQGEPCSECERLSGMFRATLQTNDRSGATDARVLLARHIRIDHPEDAR